MTVLRAMGVVCLAASAFAQVPKPSAYALVVGRSGTEILGSPPESKPVLIRSEGRIVARRMTMATLARLLTEIVGRPVTDETGLPGEYDVQLTWAPDIGTKSLKERMDLSVAVETRSIFSAVREQLGLGLVARKAKGSGRAGERAEKPGEN